MKKNITGFIFWLATILLIACNNKEKTGEHQSGIQADTSTLSMAATDAMLDKYLQKHYKTPEDYIIETFQSKDVVLLSEDHAVRHNLVMCRNLLPALYKAGVYNFGMEFGAEEDQHTLDSLVTAPEYSEAVARRIMFNYNVGWVFNEYMDIYRAAWELNRSLPEGSKPFRILNITYRFKWSACKEQYFGIRTPATISEIFDKGNTEFFRANLIKQQILDKNEKILVICGFGHAYTKYKTPYYDYREENFYRFDENRMGNILYRHAPDKVFTILLHYPFDSRKYGHAIQYAPADGYIDRAMARNDNKPAGFNLVQTPFGNLKDTSVYSIGYPNFKLSDMADGYIFYKPFDQFEGCTIDSLFLTEENWPEVLLNYPDKDVQQPPKNKEEYLSHIGRYIDLPFRYRNLQKIKQP